MLGGTDVIARALSGGQQPVYERLPQSIDTPRSLLTVSARRLLQVPQVKFLPQAHTHKETRQTQEKLGFRRQSASSNHANSRT